MVERSAKRKREEERGGASISRITNKIKNPILDAAGSIGSGTTKGPFVPPIGDSPLKEKKKREKERDRDRDRDREKGKGKRKEKKIKVRVRKRSQRLFAGRRRMSLEGQKQFAG